MAMENVEVAKVIFDKKVKAFLELDKKIKEMKQKQAELKDSLESLYKGKATEEETIEGFETFMKKIPVHRDKEFDLAALRVLLKACELDKNDFISREWKFTVDEKKIKKLTKDGTIPLEAYEKCFGFKTNTYRSTFDLIDKG